MLHLHNVESEYPQLVGDGKAMSLAKLFTADDAVLSHEEYSKKLWRCLSSSQAARFQLAILSKAVSCKMVDLDPLPITVHRVLADAIDWFLSDLSQ